jgi:hypothetical protein
MQCVVFRARSTRRPKMKLKCRSGCPRTFIGNGASKRRDEHEEKCSATHAVVPGADQDATAVQAKPVVKYKTRQKLPLHDKYIGPHNCHMCGVDLMGVVAAMLLEERIKNREQASR